MFKSIAKYALIAMVVVVGINILGGNGIRAGSAAVGFGGVFLLALVGWALSSMFSGIKSASRKALSSRDGKNLSQPEQGAD